MKKIAISAIAITVFTIGLADAASSVDSKVLASGTWNCTINGHSQQWKFNGKNGFTMNGESGKYKISGNSMDLVMGQHTGRVKVTNLNNDKLVFEDSEGITNCKKATAKTDKPTDKDNGGLVERGRQINFTPF